MQQPLSDTMERVERSMIQGDWCPRFQNSLDRAECEKSSSSRNLHCRRCPRFPNHGNPEAHDG